METYQSIHSAEDIRQDMGKIFITFSAKDMGKIFITFCNHLKVLKQSLKRPNLI